MKAFLILFALSIHTIAADLPPDAASLKAIRDAKLSDLNSAYVSALEKTKQRAMNDGDLAGAQEIEKEINKAAALPFSLKSTLLARKWVYSIPKGKASKIEVRKDGTAVYLDSGDLIWKSWKISGGKILDVTYPDGGTCRWVFDDSGSLSVSGKTHTGTIRNLTALDPG